jgi:hypothetical protein
MIGVEVSPGGTTARKLSNLNWLLGFLFLGEIGEKFMLSDDRSRSKPRWDHKSELREESECGSIYSFFCINVTVEHSEKRRAPTILSGLFLWGYAANEI